MESNGRSTSFHLITSDLTRRALWLRLFGADTLPVKAARPRWQAMRGEMGETEVLAYDLDAARLPAGARDRFAHYIASKSGQSFAIAQTMVDGWPIPAANCTAVPVDTWQERPFVFARQQAGATP